MVLDHAEVRVDEKVLSERDSGNRKPVVTIYDVARHAGVSPSTVSRALNKPGRINKNTEKRIRDAASELGYRLNPMARALHTGRTGTLALMVSDITNPVYFDLIRGAERVAAGEGSTMILAESQESPELERASVEKLQPAVDGVVLVGSRLSDDDIRDLAGVKPLILVNRAVAGIPAVIPDIEPGVTELLDHLQSLGHRSIGYLSGPNASWINQLRWSTLFERAVERGLSIVELGPSAPTREGGEAMLPRVRAAAVTAVVAYNDLMAMGLLRACRDAGIRVPEELSIVGFDDIFGADLTSPALTTVRSPMRELGEQAVRNLLAEVGGAPLDSTLTLTTQLIVRESTALQD